MFRKVLILVLATLLLGVFPPLDLGPSKEASAWPTPTTTWFAGQTISTDTTLDGEVIDSLGNVVVNANLTLNNTILIMDCFSPGLYSLTVSSGGGLYLTNGSMIVPWTLGNDHILDIKGTLDVRDSTLMGSQRVFLNTSSSKAVFRNAMINNTTSTGLYIQTPDLDIQGLKVESVGATSPRIYVEGPAQYANLTFKDMEIRGGTRGIYINLVADSLGNLTLDNVTIKSGTDWALEARPKYSATIKGCAVNGSARGLQVLTDAGSVSITNTTIRGVTSNQGIYVYPDSGTEASSTADVNIADVHMNQSATAAGILAVGRKVGLYNVKVEGTTYAVKARGNDDIDVTGLYVANTTTAEAFQAYNSRNISIGGSSVRNKVLDNVDQGMAISGFANLTISNIDIDGNGHAPGGGRAKTGIYAGQSGSFTINKVEIDNAWLYDNGDSGLYVTATINTLAGTVKMTNSTVSKHSFQGIYIVNDQTGATLHVADTGIDNSTANAINASRLDTLTLVKTRIDNITNNYGVVTTVASALLDKVTVMNAAAGGVRLNSLSTMHGDIVVKDFTAQLVSGGSTKYALSLNRSAENITASGVSIADINAAGFMAQANGWLSLDGISVKNTTNMGIIIGGIGNATLANATVDGASGTAMDVTANANFTLKGANLNSTTTRAKFTSVPRFTIANSTIARPTGTDMQLSTGSVGKTYNTTFNVTSITSSCNVTAYWYGNIRALNSLGQPVAGLNMSARDGTGTEVLNITTAGVVGGVEWLPLKAFYENSTGRNMSTAMHNFSVWNASMALYDDRNMTSNHEINFTWNTAPTIEGPTQVNVTEGVPLWVRYNLTDYEIPLESLNVTTNSTHIAWVPTNSTLIFVYELDQKGEKVRVNVSDGLLNVSMEVNVTVIHINRPPVVTLTDFNSTDITAFEDVPKYVGLNITDSDDPMSTIKVKADNENVSYNVYNMSLMFLYPNNATSGQVNVTVTDGKANVTITFNVTFVPLNDNPVIITNDNLYAYDNSEYYVDYNATDVDSEILSWFVVTYAKWLKMDSKTGELEGTPDDPDVGTVRAEVQVKDEDGGMASSAFDLIVINRNDAPRFVSAASLVATVGQEYVYDVTVFDQDNDIIIMRLEAGPKGFIVNSQSKRCSWTPSADQVGNHQVNLSADDGTVKSYQMFTLLVSPAEVPVNNKPVISSTPVTEAIAGRPYNYKVVANDIDPGDNENLSYSLVKKPVGMTIDGTGTVSWTPSTTDVGKTYDVEISVSDGKDAALQAFKVYVRLGMDKPSIDLLEPTESQTVSGKVTIKCEIIWDAGQIDSVTVMADGKLAGTMTNTPGTNMWVLELDTTAYDNGLRNIAITAKAGSAANTRSFPLIFENEKGPGTQAGIFGGPLMFGLIAIIAAGAAIGAVAMASSKKKRRAEEARQRRLEAERAEAKEMEEREVKKEEAEATKRPIPVKKIPVEVAETKEAVMRDGIRTGTVGAAPGAGGPVAKVQAAPAKVEAPKKAAEEEEYVIPYDKYTPEELAAFETEYEKKMAAERAEAGGVASTATTEAAAPVVAPRKEKEDEEEEGMEEMEVESEVIEDRHVGKEEEEEDEGEEEGEEEEKGDLADEIADDLLGEVGEEAEGEEEEEEADAGKTPAPKTTEDILDEIIESPKGPPPKDSKGPEAVPGKPKKKDGALSDDALDKILDEMIDDL